MNGQERRRSPRVRAYRPVRLRKPSTPGVLEKLTNELSTDGLRCLSPTWFPVSTEVNAEVVLSDGEEPISVAGRAVWFRILPHSDQFEMGLSFHSMSEKNKRRLSAYLENLTVKSTTVPA